MSAFTTSFVHELSYNLGVQHSPEKNLLYA